MSAYLSVYGDCEGPLGFPMADADARALDALLVGLAEVEFQRVPIAGKALTDLMPGERADVSWVSTEAVDRHKDVVLAAGMDDVQFRANPIVTVAHDYSKATVGRSLWRRKARDGATRGIKAKTLYPSRPDDWHEAAQGPWMPDRAFSLIKAGLLLGKSVGFLTLEASPPTDDEVRKNPAWAGCLRVVRKWLLLEYACHWLPVNPECCVEQVSKGHVAAADFAALGVVLPPPVVLPHTTEDAIAASVHRRLTVIDPKVLAARAVEEVYDRLRGRV